MKKRSVKIDGHATSITLEDQFWDTLKTIAAADDKPLNQLIAEIDSRRGAANLSSALRVYVLETLQAKNV